MDDDIVALLELALKGDDIKVVEERHYRLVLAKGQKGGERLF